MKEKYAQISEMVHFLIKSSYAGKENLQFVDLTCGNGHDTLFLSNLAGETGHVTALDIQETAIERTKKQLKENSLFENYDIIKDSHKFIENYLYDKIDAAVFNLGYLPQSDKKIITKPDSTIKALNSLLPYLKNEGRIYIAAYISHDKGYEIAEICDFLLKLNNGTYNVIHMKIINKKNSPPELFIIEKNT